jgi:chemosensory pili system protein ChpE/L-lysine exporter family protein LysE/ArgO
VLALFASAFALGLVFNAAPGAVFAETVRRGVRGGFRPALDVQLGSLVGDALWAVLGLAGVGLLMRLDTLRVPVAIAGIAYLLWLSLDAWRAAGREFELDDGGGGERRGALRAGAMLSVTNPQNVAYWAAVGSALGAVGAFEPTAADHAVFFAGFMASSLLWAIVCAAAVDRVFRRVGTAWARLTYRLCAAAFLALALGSVRELVDGGPSRAAAPAAIERTR